MSTTHEARQIILRVKELMIEMGKTAMPKERFVDVCTSVARDFLQKRRGAVVHPLQSFDVELLRRLINDAVPTVDSTGVAASQSLSRSPSGAQQHQQESGGSGGSGGGAAAAGQHSTLVLAPIKVAVATHVKGLLDPLYRAKKISKADFSEIVQSTTRQFFAKFPLDKVPKAQLRESDFDWIAATVNRRLQGEFGVDVSSAAAVVVSGRSTASSPPPSAPAEAAAISRQSVKATVAAAASMVPALDADAAAAESAFDLQLEKLKKVLKEQFEDSDDSALADAAAAAATTLSLSGGSSPARQVHFHESNEIAAKRKQLLREISELDAEAKRIADARQKKLEQLAALL